eukprot:14217983-Ditylum_brightwellii.AAC.1
MVGSVPGVPGWYRSNTILYSVPLYRVGRALWRRSLSALYLFLALAVVCAATSSGIVDAVAQAIFSTGAQELMEQGGKDEGMELEYKTVERQAQI